MTNRSNQHAPFGDLSHYPTLTRAQEIALADRSLAGREAEAQLASAVAAGRTIPARDRMALQRTIADGKVARDEFVTSNLKLAISVVGKKNIRPELRQDLIQEAAIGVQTAVEKFDPSKGFKFSTYATWWINQAISRSMQKNSRTIALPEDVDAEVRRLHNYQVDFCCEHGRDATEPELSQLMGLSLERIRKLR
ncbi:MAG: sigma-70 family RNA polymerase sigma factor, partial [Actinomycetes bacterium]